MTDPTLDALLAAVVAHPAEDVPRLEYADRCSELGDEARAEFVRVQCEIAAMERGRPMKGGRFVVIDADRYDALRRREVELERAHFGVWTDGLPECLVSTQCPSCEEQGPDWETGVVECRRCESTGLIPCPDNVEFRRGFVEAVTLPWDDFARHHADLRRRTPLREVTLTTNPPIEYEVVSSEDRPNRLVRIILNARLRGLDLPRVQAHADVSQLELARNQDTAALTIDRLRADLTPEKCLEKWFPGLTFHLPGHPGGHGGQYREWDLAARMAAAEAAVSERLVTDVLREHGLTAADVRAGRVAVSRVSRRTPSRVPTEVLCDCGRPAAVREAGATRPRPEDFTPTRVELRDRTYAQRDDTERTPVLHTFRCSDGRCVRCGTVYYSVTPEGGR